VIVEEPGGAGIGISDGSDALRELGVGIGEAAGAAVAVRNRV